MVIALPVTETDEVGEKQEDPVVQAIEHAIHLQRGMGPLHVLDLDPKGAKRASFLKDKYPLHEFGVIPETGSQADEQCPGFDIIHGINAEVPSAAEIMTMLSPGGYYLLPCEPALERDYNSPLKEAGFSKFRFYRSPGSGTSFLLAMRPLDETVLCDGKGMRIPRE